MQLKYNKIHLVPNLDFEEYKGLSGLSYSQIKQSDKSLIVTPKMILGKSVDEILSGNNDLNLPNYEIALNIAKNIQAALGRAIFKFVYQLSGFATVEHDGLKLFVKGRLDACIPKFIVVDFKVTENAKNVQDCINLINFMGYDKQLFNYSCLAETTEVYIAIYSKRVKNTFIIKILKTEQERYIAEQWWIERVLMHGIMT